MKDREPFHGRYFGIFNVEGEGDPIALFQSREDADAYLAAGRALVRVLPSLPGGQRRARCARPVLPVPQGKRAGQGLRPAARRVRVRGGPRGGWAMNTERRTPEPVAIGDTFHRVGDPDGPWEVTDQGALGWGLRRGDKFVAQTNRQLLDRALWTPARSL